MIPPEGAGLSWMGNKLENLFLNVGRRNEELAEEIMGWLHERASREIYRGGASYFLPNGEEVFRE